MQIDSATLYVITKCLNNTLIPSQVRQIRQIDSRIIDIELFCSESRSAHLIFDTYKPAVYLSDKKENIYSPPQTFCMTLRKHLEGARLSSIEQINLDRLIKFDFDRIEEAGQIVTKSIYAELIPSAPNLILTEKGITIDACLKGKKADRFVMGGQPYFLPSNSSRMNFFHFTIKELSEFFLFNKNEDISLQDFIYQNFHGFSHLLLTELCRRTEINSSATLSSLDEQTIKLLSKSMYLIAEEIKKTEDLRIYCYRNKQVISPIQLSFVPIVKSIAPLEWLEEELLNNNGGLSAEIKSINKKLLLLIKKENRKIDKINEELKETEKIEQYKLWGTLLSIYAYEKPEGKTKIAVSNLFKDPPEDEIIPINPMLSITENSQSYFKKYSKMKTRLQMSEKKINESFLKIKYLNEMCYFSESIQSKNELESLKEELQKSGLENNFQGNKKTRKKEFSLPLLPIVIDGFNVFVGKNNVQNDFLTLHKAKKSDLWFHAKSLPGSHIILETEGKVISEETIEKVASLAAFHSKGRSSGKVDVDYTHVKYIKKIPNGPPGLVNYTHQRTITVFPKEIQN